MGTVVDEQWDHEGHVTCVFPDGYTGSSYQGGFVFATSTDTGKMIQDSDSWPRRPESEVSAWRAACECGWQGADWTRAREPWDEDLTQRIMYADEALLSNSEEERVLEDWREHMAPVINLAALRAASENYNAARQTLTEAVAKARSSDKPASWEAIGRAIGTTKQAAHERYGQVIATAGALEPDRSIK